jgi:hypothetical protein
VRVFVARHECSVILRGVRKQGVIPRRFWVRDALKRGLPPAWLRRVRRLSRLRWISKARLLRTHGVRVRDHPLLAVKFVLLDPELESFTYELANREELLDFVADALGQDRAAIRRYADEADEDPELRCTRSWRWSRKRRLPLANRLAWYLAARVIKPEVVVETGIHDGLGSLVLLRALERNAQEGFEGRLVSFDIFEDTGSLVDDRLRGRWQRVHAMTTTHLEPALTGLQVGMSVHDATADPMLQTDEFEAVLAHRAGQLVIVNAYGAKQGALEHVSRKNGGQHQQLVTRAKNHIHPGDVVALATFPPAAGVATAPSTPSGTRARG